ncbi:hypothetical protein [Chitinophaga ginsengisegetis]
MVVWMVSDEQQLRARVLRAVQRRLLAAQQQLALLLRVLPGLQ